MGKKATAGGGTAHDLRECLSDVSATCMHASCRGILRSTEFSKYPYLAGAVVNTSGGHADYVNLAGCRLIGSLREDGEQYPDNYSTTEATPPQRARFTRR